MAQSMPPLTSNSEREYSVSGRTLMPLGSFTGDGSGLPGSSTPVCTHSIDLRSTPQLSASQPRE